MSAVSLAELHALAYGEQDKMLAIARDAHPTYSLVLHSHLETILPCREGKIVELLPAGQFGKGIANIRLQGNWSSAYIRIGGHPICSTFSATNPTGFFMTENGNCIPSFPYQAVHLDLRFHNDNMPVTVTYDIVETIKINYDTCMRFPIRSTQYAGTEPAMGRSFCKIKLPFEHPIKEICLKASFPIQSPTFQFSIYDSGTHLYSTPPKQLMLIKKNEDDTLWALDLHEHTFNFSCMPEAALLIENTNPDTMFDAWCTSLHTISIVDGIARIEFEH